MTDAHAAALAGEGVVGEVVGVGDARRESRAAEPIIAALSVQSSIGTSFRPTPRRSQSSATASRRGPLAATPPPRATAFHSPVFSARSSFAVSWPTAAAWKLGGEVGAALLDALGAEVAAEVDEGGLQAAEAEVEAGVAGHRDRQLEGARGRRRRRAVRSPARRDSRARAAARPCRRPRRRRRRGCGRGPRGPRRSRTAASIVWPPLAIRQRNGGSSGSGSRKLAATWPWRWSTGISGRRRGAAIAFAVLTPTRRAPIRPGPTVTATASTSSSEAPGLGERGLDDRDRELEVMARGDLGDDAAEARVGRRPARRSCWRGSGRRRGRAAQVSSQEVSIARINPAT